MSRIQFLIEGKKSGRINYQIQGLFYMSNHYFMYSRNELNTDESVGSRRLVNCFYYTCTDHEI